MHVAEAVVAEAAPQLPVKSGHDSEDDVCQGQDEPDPFEPSKIGAEWFVASSHNMR